MKTAFTLIELLVVMAVISLLLALSLPVMKRVREQGGEMVCRSNLRQMAMMLKTYGNSNDNLFPESSYLYHSPRSFYPPDREWKDYLICCRWHDARIGLDSPLLRHDRPELRGTLWPYLGDSRIARCKVGVRANLERGCLNACCACLHNPDIDVVPQYTYAMNAYLGSAITTGTSATGTISEGVDTRTIRTTSIRRDTQVIRSPSRVFAFGEENSWAINKEGRQPMGCAHPWAAPYDLSGKYYVQKCPYPVGEPGTMGLSSLNIHATYVLKGSQLIFDASRIGDAFATCHRPPKGDLNAGYSYAVMLDGHTQKVTVADQLRRSRRLPGIKESQLGPGGNLALAWPLDIPPPGGWDNQ